MHMDRCSPADNKQLFSNSKKTPWQPLHQRKDKKELFRNLWKSFWPEHSSDDNHYTKQNDLTQIEGMNTQSLLILT